MDESVRCDNFKFCKQSATHELVQLYENQGKLRKRILRYCEECFWLHHGRHADNWLNRRICPEKNAPDGQVRFKGAGVRPAIARQE